MDINTTAYLLPFYQLAKANGNRYKHYNYLLPSALADGLRKSIKVLGFSPIQKDLLLLS